MFSNDFEPYFDGHLNKYFLGVYPSDKIPKSIKIDHFLICNTGSSESDGVQWFCVYCPEKGYLEIFDSLGVDVLKKDIFKNHFKLRHVRKIKFNTTQVQSDSTQTCGKFCIYFIYQRLFNKDLSFNEILNEIFSTDVDVNEKVVENFVSNLQ